MVDITNPAIAAVNGLNTSNINVLLEVSSGTWWDKIWPVLVGALIALLVSFWIQERLFYEQRDAREMDRRLDAYKVFLHEAYRTSVGSVEAGEVRFSANLAMCYGSDEVRNIISSGLDPSGGSISPISNTARIDARDQILREIESRPRYIRPWWISWKRI
jgi:hypothetical protein